MVMVVVLETGIGGFGHGWVVGGRIGGMGGSAEFGSNVGVLGSDECGGWGRDVSLGGGKESDTAG